jgi:hypothetical protein
MRRRINTLSILQSHPFYSSIELVRRQVFSYMHCISGLYALYVLEPAMQRHSQLVYGAISLD